jgi:hypothetical protein
LEQAFDPNMPPFNEWVKVIVHGHPMDPNNLEDLDKVLFCSKPFRIATQYTKLKAYGNHYRVENSKIELLQTYDSEIALVFDVPIQDVVIFVNYVGVLKDILKLEYGPLHTPIILFRCEWMKHEDNQGNPTYVKDDVGFLTLNFHHKLSFMVEPFIFPSQVTQMFFFYALKKLGWQVVLWKEARFRKKVTNMKKLFITTTMETNGLSAPITLPPTLNIASLIGAMELS